MKKFMLLLALAIVSCASVFSQQITTITAPGSTSGGLSYGNGNVVTFSVRNNNPVDIIITEISSHHYQSSGSCTYQLYYSTTPSQVTGGNVANVTASPDWTNFGPSQQVNAPNGVKPFFTNIALTVPANTTMRLAITWTSASISGSTVFQGGHTVFGGPIFSANGVDLLTGNNSVSPSIRGSYPGATSAYAWIGEIKFKPSAIPCDDTVTSAVVHAPYKVCPNRPFNAKVGLPNGLNISDMMYEWEYSRDNRNWIKFTGPNDPLRGGQIVDSILVPTWYRCNIRCTTNNAVYTTPPKKVLISPFYECYCVTYSGSDAGIDIGNVTLVSNPTGDTLINNGDPIPPTGNKESVNTYSQFFDSLVPPCIYRDTAYYIGVTQINSKNSFEGAYLTVFVDFNRNGEYDTAAALGEKVISKKLDGTNNPAQLVDGIFKVPSNADIGLTGMRVIMSKDTIAIPCDEVDGDGEIEDYVVKICYRPCDGPTNPGISFSTDTSMCASYEYTLVDTTYEKARSGFNRYWQVSGDNINWFSSPNSTDKDTLNRVFSGQPLYYRLQVVCPVTDDTTYSSPAFVNVKPGYKCYCYSKAIGGNDNDSSDIGGLVIGDYNQNDGGSHIKNVNAVRARTDHTDNQPLEFFTDSVYAFHVFHTLKTVEHGDSKITVFVDFNNNHQYDIPEERIYTGFTDVGGHTLIDNLTIPYSVITDVPTGMRFILNNDVGPNIASDEACGPYTSGETEDFIVIFRRRFPTSVSNVNTINSFGIYPNPTKGKFHIQFNNATATGDVSIKLMNVTGQKVLEVNDTHAGGAYDKVLDMSGYPSGVYFVELTISGKKMVKKLMKD